MSTMSLESIDSVRISLRVEGVPQLLILMRADGQVKRMGYSALSKYEETVATGVLPGAFEEFIGSVPPTLLGRAGTYEDPGTVGHRCQWRLEFEGQEGIARFDLAYSSGSAGLPPAMAQLVERAESLTASLYEEAVGPSEEPDSLPEETLTPEPAVATGALPAQSEPTEVRPEHLPWSISEYLSFKGRIGRADYAVQYLLPLMALGFVGSLADSIVGLGGFEQLGPMGVLASLLTMWPSMAGWAKRLHDFNVSLWILPKFAAGGFLIGMIGALVNPAIAIVGLGIWAVAFFGFCLASYFWPGTDGPNDYGPPRIA